MKKLMINFQMGCLDLRRKQINKYLINKCVNGSTNQIELLKEKFNNFKVLLLALYFQKEFSQFVEKTDKLKFYSKKYLKKVVKIRTIKIL